LFSKPFSFCKANTRFTKLILILTSVCIFTRTLDTTITVLNRLRLLSVLAMSDEAQALLKLTRASVFFLLILAHALDGLLYYCYDSKMRGLFRTG
jgi:hypothetical protein